MKQAGWVVAGFLAAFLLLGASSGYIDSGRFRLEVLECQRDYYQYDQAFPQKSEKVNYCFKIDKENGSVWLFKDERHEVPNSNKIEVKQYFQELPYNEMVLPRSR